MATASMAPTPRPSPWPDVEPPNAGYYRLVVTNAAGAATSAVASLRVVLPDGHVVSPPPRA